ncbi:DNA methyltransferase [Bradyrhizobium sp. ORS 86]|uniref:DNA methyltransferase n=1 Tax=Bradyrhizobium sp. ORS 86 TaxID=1685970 RepID=UPI00388ED6B1
MTATAAKSATPILRTASGEPPLGTGGLAFRDDQGEVFEHDNPRYRSPLTKVGVLELSDGQWLAMPPGFRTDYSPFASRGEALRFAVDAAIRKAEKYADTPEGEGTHWTRDYADQVIRWLRTLLPQDDMNQGAAAAAAPPSGHPGSLQVCANSQTDPNACLVDERRAALVAISRGEEVADREMVRALVGEGLVHATTTRLVLTEEGRAFLDGESQANAGVETVAGRSCEAAAEPVSRPVDGRSSTATSERMDATAGETATNSPDAPLDERTEYKALGAIDAGVKVDGPAIARLIELGLVKREIIKNALDRLLLTEKGAQRLGVLDVKFNPHLYAFDDADASPEAGVTDDARGDLSGALNQPKIVDQADQAGYAAIEKGAEISDPIVRYLVEQHEKRKQFPAKHTFSMTTEVDDGRIVSVATCSCGDVVFRFGSNDYLRMNAAIEAHWSRNAYGPMVDGMGKPIVPGDASRIPQAAKKSRKRTSSDGGVESRNPRPVDDPKLLESSTAEGEGPAGSEGASRVQRPRKRRAGVATGPSDQNGAGGPSAPAPASPPSPSLDAGATPSAEVPQPVRTVDDASASRREPASERAQPPQADAGSPLSEPAQICAGEDGCTPAPSEAERLDWEALWAVAWGRPIDDVVAGDLIARGLIFAIDLADRSRGYGPTQAGSDRVDALRHLFDLDATRWKLGVWRPQKLNKVEPDEQCAACQPAPIGAPENVATSPDDGDDLSIEWPSYDAFLEDKVVTAPLRGIEVARDDLHPYLKPHCKDLVVWSLRLGCAAIFASFGLHKTAMQLEWCRQLVKYIGQPSLCVVPLGVRHGFIKEALQLGMDVRFVRTTEEFDDLYCEGVRYFLTNYESIREGKLDPNVFGACSLDEASVLRSYGSKTFQEFLPLFSKVPFKLVATATPSPNRYKELIHYSGFLGVMDTGLALTRFFQRNSEKAGDLTLYPHKEDEFWMWVHSWAAFLQKPSELGYSDDGYELPPLKLTWHEVPADHTKAEPERDGQGVMFRNVANSLQDAAKSRRDSLPARIAKMMELIAQDPTSHRLIWHDLEAEREAIEKALPEVVTITGSGMDIDTREERLHDFEEGRTKYFATKPVLSGSGSNFQYHCHKAIYVAMPGYGYKFNDFIQSLYRLQRFGQAFPVEVDIIYSEDERAGRAALEEKWALDTEMRRRMSEIIRAHGLNTLPLRDALLRTIGVHRVEIKGKNFTAINNDCVAETRAWPENAVDLMVTSIPFSNHYEYSPSYRDFGHTDDNGHFWSQMDFLTCELFRILKPGRLACIHVKDRVLFGAVTGQGVPTISPFHAEAIMHYRAHGFQYMGMITVVTDVVRENNQTYRLGWSENAKDSSKMGVGCPEYILLMRKPQSDRTRSYADEPVTKVNADLKPRDGGEPSEGYSRARWQVDAHAYWRSSGNRHLTPEEFAMLDSAEHAKLFSRISAERVYDFEAHVKIGENLERQGTLPATFMAIAPGSHHPDVWHDVNRMRTLNMLQQRKGAEMHLCPLQFDIVDRLIERYSNEGELVLDPFGGLMTTPYRALLKKRRGVGIELAATYFVDGVHYLRAAEDEMATPELFDLAQFDAANTPPSDDLTEADA